MRCPFLIIINTMLYSVGYLSHFVNDGLESVVVVHGEVSECLAVDFDAGLVESPHQLGVRHPLETCSSVDTLDPQCSEFALLSAAVGESVSESFLIGVFRNGPYVLACSELTFHTLENLLSSCS